MSARLDVNATPGGRMSPIAPEHSGTELLTAAETRSCPLLPRTGCRRMPSPKEIFEKPFDVDLLGPSRVTTSSLTAASFSRATRKSLLWLRLTSYSIGSRISSASSQRTTSTSRTIHAEDEERSRRPLSSSSNAQLDVDSVGIRLKSGRAARTMLKLLSMLPRIVSMISRPSYSP